MGLFLPGFPATENEIGIDKTENFLMISFLWFGVPSMKIQWSRKSVSSLIYFHDIDVHPESQNLATLRLVDFKLPSLETPDEHMNEDGIGVLYLLRAIVV